MPVNSDKKIEKLYYSTCEVAEMLDIPQSQLRYWERQFFEYINPKMVNRNIRQYTKEDIENFRIIYHLVKEKGMTLAGAKQALKANRTGTVQTAEVVARLKSIREELVRIRKELDEVV